MALLDSLVRQAERVPDLVRRQLPMPLQHRALDLREERRGLGRALRGVAVGLDQAEAHQRVLPSAQRAEDHVPLQDLPSARVSDRRAVAPRAMITVRSNGRR